MTRCILSPAEGRAVFSDAAQPPVKPTPQGCGQSGATLTLFAIAVDELAAGRLARRSKTSVSTLFGYCFVCRPEEANSQRIKALREFPTEEAALSAAEPG